MLVLNDDLKVVITKKKIKNIYFKINDNYEICVSAPKYVSDFEIKHILNDNIHELEKMYKKAKSRTVEKGAVYYLGDEYEYICSDKIMIDDEKFLAFGPSIEEINEYLEKKSLKLFQSRLDIYLDSFADLPDFRLRTRKMKTRWGVCNISSMTVTLNTALIHKKIYLIDYVICHELSHFHHMNHSAAFWKCVEEHYPLYKQARKELKG